MWPCLTVFDKLEMTRCVPNFYGLLIAFKIKASDRNYYMVNEANNLFLN